MFWVDGGLLVINIEWGAWCGWSTWGFKFICVEITAIYSGMFYQVYMEIYPYQNKPKATVDYFFLDNFQSSL